VEVANLLIIGEKFSGEFVRAGQYRTRNHVVLRLSGKVIDLFQHGVAFDPHGKLVNRWVHTTTLFVRDVPTAELRAAERIATDLCHLLSFGTMSEGRPFVFDYGGHRRRWSSDGVISQFRPPIAPDGEAIRSYVSATWNAYRKLNRSRKLPELITILPSQITAISHWKFECFWRSSPLRT